MKEKSAFAKHITSYMSIGLLFKPRATSTKILIRLTYLDLFPPITKNFDLRGKTLIL